MPVWSVQYYDENYECRPSRYGVVKAGTDGEAFTLAKENMREAKRADLIPQVVRDESSFQDGYREIPRSN